MKSTKKLTIKNLSPQQNKIRFKIPAKTKKILLNSLSVFLILTTLILTLSFFFVYVPGKKLYAHINLAKTEANYLKQALQEKDLNLIKQSLGNLKNHQKNIETGYQKLALLKSLPYVKNYYHDGQLLIDITKNGLETGDIVVTAIEPYQDFLGLKGSATDSAKTTEDRINFLTESVEGLLPHFDTIEEKIAKIDQSLTQIDAGRYPADFRGLAIQSTILQAKEMVSQIHQLVKDGKPLLSQTAWLLGKDSPRKYFLLFQNDAELRPTGGFWTAYGILQVDNGKITPLVSEDIYTLDARFRSTIPAPRPIKEYHINVPYWNLRDMNTSPDFPTSVATFMSHYKTIVKNADEIDAVVAIDTKVLVDLVTVLGRIGVPGFGNFSSEPDKRCDGCPQIIYQLEWIAGRPRNYIETNRKGFLAPLMHSILSNAMGSEKEKLTPLIQGLLQNVYQKHLLFYFTDADIQKAAVAANIAGSIKTTDSNTDYFHLNDANMSSAKTNLFLKQKIKHQIISKDGQVEHKVVVTYTNPSKASNCNLEKGDLCLNAPKYRNWFRFYLPLGSELIKMTGSEIEPVQYEELGKQVFEGFYGDKYPLYAESSTKTSIQYTSSINPGSDYTLLLQKQPGTKVIPYQLIVNGQEHSTFDWATDKTIKLAL